MYDLTLTFYRKNKILTVSNIDGVIKTFGNVNEKQIMDHPSLNNWFSIPMLRYRKTDITHVCKVDGEY